jgi:hypothetical protein
VTGRILATFSVDVTVREPDPDDVEVVEQRERVIPTNDALEETIRSAIWDRFGLTGHVTSERTDV